MAVLLVVWLGSGRWGSYASRASRTPGASSQSPRWPLPLPPLGESELKALPERSWVGRPCASPAPTLPRCCVGLLGLGFPQWVELCHPKGQVQILTPVPVAVTYLKLWSLQM